MNLNSIDLSKLHVALTVGLIFASESLMLQIKEKLAFMNLLVARFIAFMTSCSVDEFLKMGPLHGDMGAIEKR